MPRQRLDRNPSHPASGTRSPQPHSSGPDAQALVQRAQLAPTSLTPADVTVLQRTVGNRATRHLLSQQLSGQADQAAGPVIHAAPAPAVQKKDEEQTSFNPQPFTTPISFESHAGAPPVKRAFVKPKVQCTMEEVDALTHESSTLMTPAPVTPAIQRTEWVPVKRSFVKLQTASDRIQASPALAAPEGIQRAYVKGSAAADAALFEKATPIPDEQVTPLPKVATDKGITSTNLGHYLERHTYKYQKLNAKTVSPAATLFPHGTTADNVKTYLLEALGKVKDTDTIGTSPVSLAVDLSNGIKVNLGALKNNKLAAFFPLSGPGVANYTADELKAIRDEKNK